MQLYVGQAALKGGLRRYPFDLLEIPIEPNLPKPKVLSGFRESKPDCRFSLRISLPKAEKPKEEVVERMLGAQQALGAAWGVVTTGPSTTPTTRHRKLLENLFERLRRDEWRLAWEPRGVWGDAEAERWADELGVTLVRDLSRDPRPPGSVLYTRLRALGLGKRVGVRSVEQLAERLIGADEAYVVLEGEGVARAANLIRELCGDAGEPID